MPRSPRLASIAARPAPVAALSVALAAPAFAADVHVDAVNGSDATGTGNAAQPWTTITHALAQLPAPPELFVHAAARTYDAALGERLPAEARCRRPSRRCGRRHDVARARRRARVHIANETRASAVARARAPTLRQGVAAIELVFAPAHVGPYAYPIADFAIDGMSWTGIEVGAGKRLHLDGVSISGCKIGVLASAGSGSALATLAECVVASCESGVTTSSQAELVGIAGARVALRRTTVHGCATGTTLSATSCGDTGNGTSEVSVEDSLLHSCTTAIDCCCDDDVWLRRSTIAGNGKALRVTATGNQFTFVSRDGANLQDNQLPDVVQGTLDEITSYSNTQGGVLGGSSNVSVDPLFVDPANDDYRLLPGSPLIDRGDPALVQLGIDLGSDPRVLDGDFDLVARVDVGFDEWNPVHLAPSGVAAPGATIGLTASAPPAWLALTFLASAPADLPLGPGGNVLIDPQTAALLGGGPAPFALQLALPASPSIVGLTAVGQAVGVAPTGAMLGLGNRIVLSVQ